MNIPSPTTEPAQAEFFRAQELTVSLTVKDIDASMAWYRDVLGFGISQKHEREGKLRAVTLKAGAVRLLLGQDDGARGWERIKGEGISLYLTTDLNIDEVAQRIKAEGGTLDSEPTDTPWGVRAFRLRDPDGFRLTISSARGA